jgi:hypothetical protein
VARSESREPKACKARAVAKWLLQCSPAVWDVFAWWEGGESDLEGWTVARHLDEMRPEDDFAFWIGGRDSGVYAVGRVASRPYSVSRVHGEYWLKKPTGPVHAVDLRTTRYLFDAPIRKAELIHDRNFKDALILRMPRSPNPIELSDREWLAIRMRAGTRGTRRRPEPDAGDIVVTERPLGAVKEKLVPVSMPAGERLRKRREALMVKRYERFLKRKLMVKSARMPGGDRLVADAFDPKTDRLIEAKSTSSRQDVRMAIGQLLDYRRHVCPKADLAVLLPTRPSDDVRDLLRDLHIAVIVEERRGRFRRL